MASDNGREEDLLSYKNAHSDLESLIQSVLSSFAFSLENAALEEYHSETSYIPPETTRLVSQKKIFNIFQTTSLAFFQVSWSKGCFFLSKIHLSLEDVKDTKNTATSSTNVTILA